MSYQDTFLEDCSGWIKSNIRHYTNQYFPNSEARETRRTLRDLNCPFCQEANATIPHRMYLYITDIQFDLTRSDHRTESNSFP